MDDSLERYADEISRFVAFAIKTTSGQAETEYRLPLSNEAKAKALELHVALKHDDSFEACIQPLHQFLMLSIAAINSKAYEDCWQDVLTCWLAVRGMKWATVFMEPADYTQLLARFKYDLRCIYFYNAYLEREDYETGLMGYALLFQSGLFTL